MVPNTEVNLAEGRNERSTEDAYIIESESVTNDEELEGLMECEILMGMKRARFLWASEKLHLRRIYWTKGLMQETMSHKDYMTLGIRRLSRIRNPVNYS